MRITRRLVVAVGLLIGAPIVVACGSLLGSGSDDDEPSSSPDANAIGREGSTGMGTIDLDANIADCTNRPSAGDTDLFVTVNALAGGACSADNPCPLKEALSRNPGGGTINLAPGIYVGDVVLRPNVHLVGGWGVEGKTWTPVCDQRLVFLQGTSLITVRADNAPNTSLMLLTVVTAAGAPGPSEPRYGIFATQSTTLVLDSVAVAAGHGGDGAWGNDGGVGSAAPTSCPSGDGMYGGSGIAGAAATVSYGPGGITITPAGFGNDGLQGHDGTPGGPGGTNAGVWCEPEPSSTCTVKGLCNQDGGPTGKTGVNGCGGGGGIGGGAGTSGGGSVAVFAWAGANVIVRGGALASGSGGAGGAGGQGGLGAGGSVGEAGAQVSAPCFPSQAQCAAAFTNSCLPDPTVFLSGGAAGGPGGRGGNGGRGGGGAGGPSFAILTGADAGVEVNGTQIVFDLGGDGGAPNGLPGASGARGP